MNYKLINEALKDITALRCNHPKFKKVSESFIDNLRGGERQGEYDEYIEVYSLGEDDLHIKLVLTTNSYGGDEAITSIQFVKPVVKQVTDFEIILNKKNSMTVAEILAEVERQDISVDDFGYGDINNPLENIGEWEEVKQRGGEGKGEVWYSVKYFKDHDVYIKTDGFYSSYNGTDFEDGYGEEVIPQQKTITVYE